MHGAACGDLVQCVYNDDTNITGSGGDKSSSSASSASGTRKKTETEESDSFCINTLDVFRGSNNHTSRKSIGSTDSTQIQTQTQTQAHAQWSHGSQFFTTLLPRLHSFRNALMRVRADDGLRYGWLLASPEERRVMLQEWNPDML
jgi:hypothetical protein